MDEVDIVNPKRAHKHKQTGQPSNLVYKLFLGVIGLVVIVGISFYAGISYQKNKTSNLSSTTTQTGPPTGGFARRFSGSRTFGTVSAISSTSITVTPQNGGNDVTYSIDSNTVIDDNGQTVTTSDIQSGTTVMVSASSTTTKVARRILVNPAFGGFNGGAPTPQSSGSGSQPPTSVN